MADSGMKVVEGTAIVTVERPQKSELARIDIADARRRLDVAVEALKVDAHELNPLTRLRKSIKAHPVLWLGGAIVVGALLGGLSQRNRYKEST